MSISFSMSRLSRSQSWSCYKNSFPIRSQIEGASICSREPLCKAMVINENNFHLCGCEASNVLEMYGELDDDVDGSLLIRPGSNYASGMYAKLL